MDHGAVIHVDRARGARTLPLLLLVALALGLPAPATAAVDQPGGATLVAPADGHHFDHLELAPMVQFDPSKDAAGVQETPKWVLLAEDRAMTKTVRYCRQFVWAASDGAYHWGCNRWATGADQFGNDQLRPLTAGTVYYWQVVSSSADRKSEVKSAVRAFAVDAEPTQPKIEDISAQVHGTAFDDGSFLNLGAAALVNSGVRVGTLRSRRLATYAFRITGTHVGTIDPTRSYLKVTSAAGTRYLRVASVGTGGTVQAVWRLTAAERRLRTKRFGYQLFVKSRKNAAMVKSPQRVVVLRSPAKRPEWTPDRTTVNPL